MYRLNHGVACIIIWSIVKCNHIQLVVFNQLIILSTDQMTHLGSIFNADAHAVTEVLPQIPTAVIPWDWPETNNFWPQLPCPLFHFDPMCCHTKEWGLCSISCPPIGCCWYLARSILLSSCKWPILWTVLFNSPGFHPLALWATWQTHCLYKLKSCEYYEYPVVLLLASLQPSSYKTLPYLWLPVPWTERQHIILKTYLGHT
jgi:hypothetical protein